MRCASLDHHPVGVHHQPDRGVLAVAEDLVHRDHLAHQPLDLGEHVLARHLDVDHPRDRLRGADQAALPREHLLQPPVGDVGEAEQPQRLAGRGAVDDHRVELAGVVVALDLQQAEELVHARRDGQLLGGDVHHPAVGEQRAEPALDRAPVRLHLALRLHLLAPEPLADRGRVGPERGLERVGEAVRRVGGDDDRAQPGGGAAAGGRGGDAGLADAALAGVEDGPRGVRGVSGVMRGAFRVLRYAGARLAITNSGETALDPNPNPPGRLRARARDPGIASPAAAATTAPTRIRQTVLDETFNNDTKVTSGDLSLTASVSADGDRAATSSPAWAARSRATPRTRPRSRSSTGR